MSALTDDALDHVTLMRAMAALEKVQEVLTRARV